MANLTNSQEPELEPEPVGAGCFGSLEPGPEPFEKKNQEPEPVGGKKKQEPEPGPLENKSGAGAGAEKKNFAGSPALISSSN